MANTTTSQPKIHYRKDYTQPDYLIDKVDLHFDLYEDHTMVKSYLVINKNKAVNTTHCPLVLAGENLELLSVVIDGQALTAKQYECSAEHLTIPQVPDHFILEITVRIQPQLNTTLNGLYKSNGNYCTQCEPHGFRRITYFIDRPDVMAKYTTTITADKALYPILLSNGNCIAQGETDLQRHWVKWEDPFRKPSYLFALVAGDLECIEDHFTTHSGRKVLLRIFVEKGNASKSWHAMESLKQSMRWDEENYGREYDLDIFMIVAVSDFNMGAMENKGLNIFNSKYVLANPETATDKDYEGISMVVAHEYFHNWTGDRVTCRDWFQLSLKEGLTVFRDQCFTADVTSIPVKRINEIRNLRALQFKEDDGPLSHAVRPDSYIEMNNFYTKTVYEKGAEVIRMMYTLLGPAAYRKGMDLYFQRHDGQAVTCDDFVAAMEDANQFDLKHFRLWYSQAGTPRVDLKTHYDAVKKQFSVSVKQMTPPTPGQAHKEPLHIPMTLALFAAHGKEIPLAQKNQVVNIHQAEETFCFENIPEKPIASFFRGFSAPVKYHAHYTEDELLFLLAHDTDPVNRWDAGQQLATTTIFQLIQDYNEKRSLKLKPQFTQAFQAVLENPQLDKAFIAETLSLPSEIQLGETMQSIEVEALHDVRNFVILQLSSQLKANLLTQYHNNHLTSAYQYEMTQVGQRSLKNSCLYYLMRLNDKEIQNLCMKQFSQANNMTDRLSAIGALANSDCPQRVEALEQFYNEWQHEALVIDKWFMIQALSELPNTFERIQELMHHPAFTMKNPNRLRALISVFCGSNHYHFHHASGKAYVFLADQIIYLNQVNPQVSARLAEPLFHWRRYDGGRQALMHGQLERILRQQNLSKDVYEVVSKALG